MFTLSVLVFACGSSKIEVNDLASANPIAAIINLSQVQDDKAPVIINPGRFNLDTVVYRLPRIIQGSYAVNDFGKYIDDLKAIDYNGNLLPLTKLDDNTWQITNANQLDKLEYYVSDTYDIEIFGGIDESVPFSPGGTNISPENYVLNLHGFIGYFDSLKKAQYTLDVTAPANFERTSALQNTNIKSSPDGTRITTSYFAPRYFDITDNPMMYGDLDVEEFMVGDIKIVLSVYSPNNKHKASTLKETVYKMMEAQKAYLGNINSTSRYDIYLYLSDGSKDQPKGFGALEHHTSTVAVLRENSTKEQLAQSVIDVIAHEFFHIFVNDVRKQLYSKTSSFQNINQAVHDLTDTAAYAYTDEATVFEWSKIPTKPRTLNSTQDVIPEGIIWHGKSPYYRDQIFGSIFKSWQIRSKSECNITHKIRNWTRLTRSAILHTSSTPLCAGE